MAKIYTQEEIIFHEHPKSIQFVDLTGFKYGKLKVLGFAGSGKRGHKYWFCLCDCGNSVRVGRCDLTSGHTASCGCLQVEKTRKRCTKHGHSKRGKKSLIYGIWLSMLNRCRNPKYHQYKDYGGRGIQVCERWKESFENFLADMGERPQGKTLERNEVNGNYEPSNCRWATTIEQGNNKRNNVFLTYNGETKTISQWNRYFGFGKNIVSGRLRLGWSVEKALTTPIKTQVQLS